MSSDLTVKIGGDATGLAGKLKETEGIVGRFGGRLAGALSIAAVAGFVNKMIQAGSETVRTAHNINLTAAAVQVLNDKAQEAGIAADSMFAAVQKVQNAQIEAIADGASKAADSFRKMGVDVRGMDSEQVFIAFATALSKAGSNAEALAAAVDIIGARNAKLLATIKDIGKEGPDAINKLRQAMGAEFVDDASLAQLQAAALASQELGDKASAMGQTIVGKVSADILLFGRTIKAWLSGQSFSDAAKGAVARDVFAKGAAPGGAASAAAATSGVQAAPMPPDDLRLDIMATRDAMMKELADKMRRAQLDASGRSAEADALDAISKMKEAGAFMMPGDEAQIMDVYQRMAALKKGPDKALMENAMGADNPADRLARIGALSGRAGSQDLAARTLSIQQQQLAELKKLAGKDGALGLV